MGLGGPFGDKDPLSKGPPLSYLGLRILGGLGCQELFCLTLRFSVSTPPRPHNPKETRSLPTNATGMGALSKKPSFFMQLGCNICARKA